MRRGEVSLGEQALVGALSQKVDMHLVGADLRALMTEMGEVKSDRIVLGLAEGERHAAPVVIAADQDVIGPWQGRAADQRVHAMQVTAARGPSPIVEGLGEGCIRAD